MNQTDDRKWGQGGGGVDASVIKVVFDGGALGRGAFKLELLGEGEYGARARAQAKRRWARCRVNKVKQV